MTFMSVVPFMSDISSRNTPSFGFLSRCAEPSSQKAIGAFSFWSKTLANSLANISKVYKNYRARKNLSNRCFSFYNRKEVYFLNDVGHIMEPEDCQLRCSGLQKVFSVKSARARSCHFAPFWKISLSAEFLKTWKETCSPPFKLFCGKNVKLDFSPKKL